MRNISAQGKVGKLASYYFPFVLVFFSVDAKFLQLVVNLSISLFFFRLCLSILLYRHPTNSFLLHTNFNQLLYFGIFPHSLAFTDLLYCFVRLQQLLWPPYFQPFFCVVCFCACSYLEKNVFALETYGQTGKQCLRNKNHTWETSNVSECGRKHFCFPGSKFCFRNNVSMGAGQIRKHLRKHTNHKCFRNNVS